MTAEAQIKDYLELLSSKAPVPGGGGASALAGALGDSLGQMVVHLTLGKKRYAQAEQDMLNYERELKRLQQEFLMLAYKEKVMEERLVQASYVPLEIMEKAAEMLGILKELAEKGSVMAVSDVGVGVQFARTAILGAVMNVYINTRSMKDRKRAEELNREAKRLTKEGTDAADRIYEKIVKQLQG